MNKWIVVFFSFYIQTLEQGCDNSYKSMPNSTFPPTDRVSELYNYDSLYSSRIVIQLIITTIYLNSRYCY